MSEGTLRFKKGRLEVELDEPSAAALLASVAGLSNERGGRLLSGPASKYREVALQVARDWPRIRDEARRYGIWESVQELARHLDPYPHQTAALEAWVASGGCGIVILPTGAGKTVLATMAIKRIRRDTLVIVPTLNLMEQWLGVLRATFDLECGAVGGGSRTLGAVTVITYDSAQRKMAELGDRFGLIVFDECHHMAAESGHLIAEAAIAPFRLGLTATLQKEPAAREAVCRAIGPVVFEASIDRLSGTILAPYRSVRLSVELTHDEKAAYDAHRERYLTFCREKSLSLGGVRGWHSFLKAAMQSRAGREAWESWRIQRDLALRASNKMKVLERLLQQHAGDRILLFTHVNQLAYEISCRHLIPVITHKTPAAERVAILQGFATGRFKALVTSKVLNEGVDVPDANVAIVVSGSGSGREHVQRLGRILRRGGPEKEAVLYELLAEGTHEMELSSRRRKNQYFSGKTRAQPLK